VKKEVYVMAATCVNQRTRRAPEALILGFAIASVFGCHGAHFTVQNAALLPEQAPSFKTASPEVPAIVQIANFTIGAVDTQYPEEEKNVFRRHMAVAIPNILQDYLGKKQVFANVTRSSSPIPAQADYTVTGEYDFFERLGTGGREWIPFYGTFGGSINEAWVKGTTTVVVADAKTGAEILRKSYAEEHRDRTSIYQRPNVGYMQADYVAGIATEITDAIKARTVGGKMESEGGAVQKQLPKSKGGRESTAERLKTLEALRQEGVISEREFNERRGRILDDALGR
jgi:hypothetical protein